MKPIEMAWMSLGAVWFLYGIGLALDRTDEILAACEGKPVSDRHSIPEDD